MALMNKTDMRPLLLTLTGARPFDLQGDRRLTSTRLLTVDAFDTLITRAVFHPTDVFTICGTILREREIIGIEATEWRDRRHQAETDLARSQHPREVRLDQIYDHLAKTGLISAGNVVVAREIETAIERSLSRPIAATINRVNSYLGDGGAVRVLSDSYLTHEDVSGLLDQAGLMLGGHAIHVSSQSGNTKRSGTLFRSALSKSERTDNTTLHIGDNIESDCRQARRAGLGAAPYLDGKPNRFEQYLSDHLQTPRLLGSIIAGSARATRLARALPDPHLQAIWDLSSSMTGPLLFSFVAWTLREAAQRGIRTLYFFSRDGEILLQVAEALQHGAKNPITCRYLYVSRQSLHLPGVTNLGEIERKWILDNASYNGLRYLLARLDITVDEFLALLPFGSPLRRLDPDMLMTPPDIAAMTDSLDHAPVDALILERAAQRREICLDYMREQELLAPGHVGVVDIGWRGRLQGSLCRAIATVDPEFSTRLHGFYIDLESPPTDAGTFSTFSALCGSEFSWAARGSLFEIFCAAHHGTVKNYMRTDRGTVVPVLASEANQEATDWGLAIQQEAVTTFCREAARGLRLARLDVMEHVPALAQAAVEIVQMFVSRPGAPEAAAFGAFAHSSDERHDRVEQMAGPIDFRPHALLKRLGPAYKYRRISYWPEGSLARSVPGWLRSLALSMLRAMPGRHA